MIFFGLKFWPKLSFSGSMKDARIFLGHKKKTEGLFGVAKKGLRDFLCMLKKVVIVLGRQILKL